ncbi:hypothetical protein [Hymenobacter sp. BT730]|uniref:hypothetical protein n=1 Tax=Hymenobacter sp. BT730 TaxID=3063332 RepID=UPI0026E0BE13|nr:hypothetical protein [Hymenobacter sp. BT730]
MGLFDNIDIILERYADEQNAVLTKNRKDTSVYLFKFEERRIDWQHNEVNLAVIIQHDFSENGVDTSKWNFVNVAWKDIGPNRFASDRNLVNSADFRQIEMHIEELLRESVIYLNNIEFEDLKLVY